MISSRIILMALIARQVQKFYCVLATDRREHFEELLE